MLEFTDGARLVVDHKDDGLEFSVTLNEEDEESPRKATFRGMMAGSKMRRWGLGGTLIGLIALVAAVLPLWVLPAIFPPRPIDQVIVDTATKVKERLVAQAKGEEYQVRVEKNAAAVWYQACSIAAISLGLVALGLAAFSFLRREDWRYTGAAAALGGGAIAFEIAITALAIFVGLAILVAVIKYTGINL